MITVIRMIYLVFLSFSLLSQVITRNSFSLYSVTKKVTEESKEITIAAETLNLVSKETAELLGITQQEAKQEILEALSSTNGLDKEGSILSPSTAFCCKDKLLSLDRLLSKSSSSNTCSLQQFVPIHPAGFPHIGSQQICPGPSSPDCHGILVNCIEKCPACSKCDKFRTIDGKCNNLSPCTPAAPYPGNWGSRNHALRRLNNLNNYHDGTSEPTGGLPPSGLLPTAREVSNYIHANAAPPTGTHSHMLMQLGQFIDHDISFTPEVDLNLKEDCCADPSPPNCFPMPISPWDPDFTTTCKDFVRSAPKCHLGGIRQQFNAITSYLDGSQIYGSDEALQAHLRTGSEGLLRVSTKDSEDFLPIRTCPAGYGGGSPLGDQFQAGDRRVTENPGLSSLHTIFMREHNRIAREIDALKSWDDERIYQEARRIVIAELQNIIYKEFLPIILGSDTVPHSVNSVEYDQTEDASVSNVFATAAYRFGHTLITGIVDVPPSDTYDLTEHFFNIDEIWNNGHLDSIIQGGAAQAGQESDRFIHDSVRNTLFKSVVDEGTDLAARNIQRGRDHGLGTFKQYREEVCGLTGEPLVWQSGTAATGLFSLYGGGATGYSKLEIFPGGLLEKIDPAIGGLVGPTFRCLIKKQFQSLKDGDRFFFTHKKNTCKCEYNCHRFTATQQNHIMNRSLRDILCDNTDTATMMLQPEVLKEPGPGNTVQACPASSTLNVGSLLTPDICISQICEKKDFKEYTIGLPDFPERKDFKEHTIRLPDFPERMDSK